MNAALHVSSMTVRERAQRVLDRLPRPPFELPINDPTRVAYDLLRGVAECDEENEALRDEARQLEDEQDDSERELDGLREALTDAAESLDAACNAAEEDDNGSLMQRLNGLVVRCREIAREAREDACE